MFLKYTRINTLILAGLSCLWGLRRPGSSLQYTILPKYRSKQNAKNSAQYNMINQTNIYCSYVITTMLLSRADNLCLYKEGIPKCLTVQFWAELPSNELH